MFHIAAGVCLGIVAAIYLLNWLGSVAEWRQERRRRKQYRRGMQMLYPDRYPEQSTPDQYQNHATDRFAGLFILCILGGSLLIAYFGH